MERIELLKSVCRKVSNYSKSREELVEVLKNTYFQEHIVRYLLHIMLNEDVDKETCELFDELSTKIMTTQEYDDINVIEFFCMYTMTEYLKNN